MAINQKTPSEVSITTFRGDLPFVSSPTIVTKHGFPQFVAIPMGEYYRMQGQVALIQSLRANKSPFLDQLDCLLGRPKAENAVENIQLSIAS